MASTDDFESAALTPDAVMSGTVTGPTMKLAGYLFPEGDASTMAKDMRETQPFISSALTISWPEGFFRVANEYHGPEAEFIPQRFRGQTIREGKLNFTDHNSHAREVSLCASLTQMNL